MNKTLTAQHRCERCGAQAYLLYVTANDDDGFLLCAHHGHEFGASLMANGYVLAIDNTALLVTA